MNDEYPIAGSIQYLEIASGSCSATSSTSIPPCAVTMTTGFFAARSIVIET